ncbi:GntR family transcriptional regulator [Haloechinothrix alba]|nr:GntR family transcriptional regulator [Haloechinothrix alba]
MTTLDAEDARPAYRRVADQLTAAIESGKLAPGDQLPTHKALADEYGVAVETAKRALTELRNAGLVVTRQGKGSYVRRKPDDEERSEPVVSEISARVDELARELERVKERVAALEADSAGE